MTENRHNIIVDARLTEANGTAERATALEMIKDKVGRGGTVGGDKRTLTPPILSPGVANSAARHMSRRPPAIAVRQLMAARRAILASASAR